MRIYLVHNGDGVEVPYGETVIGRDAGCTLRFHDSSVSRRHARIVHRRDELLVEDLGSTNGTRVNGRIVTTRAQISPGDVLTLGARDIEVRAVVDDRSEPATTELEHAAVRAPWHITTVPMTIEAADAPSVRDNVRRLVELDVVYVSDHLEVEAVTRDLSLSGVFVCSQVLDPVGTACQLTLGASTRQPLRIEGIVRRVVDHERSGGEPVGIAVEFVRVGDAERTWLSSIMARAPARPTRRQRSSEGA